MDTTEIYTLAEEYARSGEKHTRLKAVDLYREAAQNNHPAAQYIMGQMLEWGVVGFFDPGEPDTIVAMIPINCEESEIWYRRAAGQGYTKAQCKVAWNCLCEHNVNEALKWYNEAACLGDVEAMCRLGELYREGEYVEKDLYKSISYYKMAAEKGDQNDFFELVTFVQDYLEEEGDPNTLNIFRDIFKDNPELHKLVMLSAEEE